MEYKQLLCLEQTKIYDYNNKNGKLSINFNERLYSSSYGGTTDNFLMRAHFENRYEVNQDAYGLLCVLQNILQRGQKTKPSEYLISKFGELTSTPISLVGKNDLIWRNIKGDDENAYYPARKFYDDILSEYLGEEYSFVKRLILPEAKLSDILDSKKEFYGQQVDFYLPQAKLVIEIDGSSHFNPSQVNKDATRDSALHKAKIRVFRVTTDDLEHRTSEFKQTMEAMIKRIVESKEIQAYKNSLDVATDDVRIKFDAVMRIQMMFINAYMAGFVPLDKSTLNIHIINTDTLELPALLEAAYNDFTKWMNSLIQLAKVPLKLPELKVESDDDVVADINLDFCMLQRYTDNDISQYENNTVQIRTAYMPNKDHYRIAISTPIKYKFNANTYQEDEDTLRFFMKNIFGHKDFRDGQTEIIRNALSLEDTIGILPTGTGKSLCYQLSVLLQPCVSIVTIPLIALMGDQKKSMVNKNIDRAAYINSTVVGEERGKLMEDFLGGKYQFMLISPERTQNEDFRRNLQLVDREMSFAYAVIDEVHCLSEWGHDFRVAYLRLIPNLRRYCTNVCLLGLTATASQAVLDDLKAEFDNDGRGIKALASMDRQELTFKKITSTNLRDKLSKVKHIINEENKPYTDCNGITKNSVGLIFCQTVGGMPGKICGKKVAAYLPGFLDGKNVLQYYGGDHMPNPIQKINQDKFMDKEFSGVMVCTKAFGMGVDKENVKYTIHTTIPQSIESFFQEAGRAGRDEDKTQNSNCYILATREPSNERSDNMVSRIFNISTSVEERTALGKEATGDLNSIMYFWNESHKTFKIEYACVKEVLNQIYNKQQWQIRFDNGGDDNQKLLNLQNAIYKLTILGVIKNWTVEYSGKSLGRGTLTVEYQGINREEIRNNLVSYIKKHDTEFELSGRNPRYKKYYEVECEQGITTVEKYAKILYLWTADNILYSRLQSTYNMYELCSDSVSNEEFRARIVDYFKYDSETMVFETVVKAPNDFKQWFDILYAKDNNGNKALISREKAQSQLSSLMRYLESYGKNTGLNYLSGMLRLLCCNYEGTDGEWRLKDSFSNLTYLNNKEYEEIILKQTFDIAKHFESKEKNALSRTLIEVKPDYAPRILKELDDEYSKAYIIRSNLAKARKTLKETLGWTM